MRVLVPLLILVSLAAACGGGSKPGSTPTPSSTATATRVPAATPTPTTEAVIPFTPVEEVLTPPPDIDTSGWLTYQDQAHGFELRYPPYAQVKENVRPPTFGVRIGAHETGTEIDLSFTRGTTLENKYVFITETDESPDQCIPTELTYALKMHATPNVQYPNCQRWVLEEPQPRRRNDALVKHHVLPNVA
jgi:hypothetical protein